MPFVQAKCPECGGMLAVDDSKKAAMCQFCGEAFIVQEAVNNYITNNITNNNTIHNYGEGAVVNVYENQNSVSALIERAFMFLEDGDFSRANEYCEKVLDIEPGNAQAYLGKLMVDLKLHTEAGFDTCTVNFEENKNYKKIAASADERLKESLKKNLFRIIFDINDGVLTTYRGSATNIVIPDNVQVIGEYAFSGCTNLISITIPDTVTSIGKRAFNHCENLISINIPNSVKNINREAFACCYNLTSIRIPESVRSIGDSVFYECKSLVSILIPNTVTDLGSYVFSGCYNLTSVTLGNNITKISREVFNKCKCLNSINVDEKNPNYSSVDGVLFNKEKTKLIWYPEGKADTNYIIPNGVKNIGKLAFCKCKHLKSVTIPNTVINIGPSAFIWCTNLTDIIIPNNVKSIGDSAFVGTPLHKEYL